MSSSQRSRARARLPLGVGVVLLLASVSVNFAGLVGGLTFVKVEPYEPEPKEEVTVVEFDAVPDIEEKLPEEEEEELEPPEPERPEPERPKPELEPEPEPEPEVLPEPEPEPEEEPPPEEEQPEPPPNEIPPNMKMVEQLDQFDEKEAPEDVDYLSNINRDVTEQTRAEMTNWEEDAETAKAMQLELSEKPVTGTAAETEVAQTEQQESQVAREAPKVKISPEEARPEQQEEAPLDQLAAKEEAEVEPEEAQEEIEDLAVEAESGELAAAQDESSTVLPQEHQSRVDHHDKKYKFTLSQDEMAAVFGNDISRKRDIISKDLSRKEGIWEKQRENWQSPLENVVPEVKPGNQTALRSRKHPFAQYIAKMHRKIHPLWGDGYLTQLDTRGRNHPLNDKGLWTRVEIVLKPDGQIDALRTIHWSGVTAFDAAARDIVRTAGPFPNPPDAIRSGNGKIYMHWTFHRDERACGTFGATPYILDNAGRGDIPDAHAEIDLDAAGGGGGHAGHGHGGGERRLATGPSGPSRLARESEGPMPPGGAPAGGATGTRSGGSGGGGSRAGASGGSGGGSGSGSHPATRRRQAPPGSRGGSAGPLVLDSRGTGRSPAPSEGDTTSGDGEVIDPAAKSAASSWVRALAKGELSKLVARSSVPFKARGTVAARTPEELEGFMASMIDDSRGLKASGVKIYTAAQLRRKFGSLPAGVEEGSGDLYATVKVGNETLTLVLRKRFGRWKVSGFTR